jgi:RNA polymerase sigma-70 factor (ECF subfamily)
MTPDGRSSGGPTAGASDVERLLGDRGRLLALARRLAGGDDEADDLAQETWLRAWLHPPGEPRRAGGWIRRIASNLSATWRSRAAARAARERSVAVREAQPATDALVAQVELHRALADALLELDEPHRRVVLLRFWEQKPPRAIALQLGVPVETVRTRQKRAIARLRERLDGRCGSRDAWCAAAWTAGAAAMGGTTKVAAAGIVIAIGFVGWQVARVTEGDRRGARPEDVGARFTDAGTVELDAATNAVGTSREVGAEGEGATTDAGTVELDAATNAVGTSREVGAEGEGATPAAQRSADVHVTAPLFARVELRGRVVEAAGGAPIADAKVALQWFERDARDPTASFDRQLSVASDADGRWRATAERVAVDFFAATITHPGHARAAVSKQATERQDDRAVVDFGATELHVGARIVGRVVTLPERRPVADAALSLGVHSWAGPGTFQLDAARPVGTTRGDGSFELAERVLAENAAAVLYAFGDGRIGFALFRTTGGSDRIEIEVALEPPGALGVRVVDRDGTPVADAKVIAYPTFAPFGARDDRSGLPPQPTFVREPWKSLFSGTTDEAGLILFVSLPEGRADALLTYLEVGHLQAYQLHVVADGWPRAFESVLVQRGERREVTVKLLPPTVHRIVGRVTSGGAPLAGATIAFEGFGAVTSGADGRYATGDRHGPIGSVDGRATAEGHVPGECGATRDWVRSRITTTPIEDPNAAAAADAPRAREEFVADFELAPAATVSGRVVDEAGEPVAGILVRVEGLAEDGSRWVSLDAKGGATGTDGRFEIEGVGGAGGDVTAEAPDGWLAPFPQRAKPGERGVEIVLQRLPASTARAVVKVRDAASGEPATPARALAWPRSANVRWRPGATIGDGEVTVEELFPGEWDLRVELADGRKGLLPFRVASPDERLALDLRVGGGAIVDGQLMFDGKPLQPNEGQRCFIWVRASTNDSNDAGHALDADGRPVSGLTGSVAVADAEGRFTMARLLPGVAIRFQIDGKEHRASVSVVLEPGERRKIELELAPGSEVAWRMGESLPPGRILLELARGDEPLCREEECPIDAVGTVIARTPRPAGPLRWRATWTASRGFPPEQRVASGSIDLAAGATATIDLSGFR